MGTKAKHVIRRIRQTSDRRRCRRRGAIASDRPGDTTIGGVFDVVIGDCGTAVTGWCAPTQRYLGITGGRGERSWATGFGECSGGTTGSEVNRRQVVTRRRRVVPGAQGRSRSAATASAIAPTFHRVVVQNGTSMGRGGDNCSGRAPGAKWNSGECVAHFRWIISNAYLISVTKFSIKSISPTFDCVIIQQCTSVGCTGGDGDCRSSRPQSHGLQIVSHLAWPITDVRGIAGPKTSIGTTTPTFDTAVVEQGTGVHVTRGDGSGR